MAISGRYTAVLDACVLFPRLQRDVLLSLAHADLYTARWTQEIEMEWTTSVVEKYPDAGEKIPRLLEQMRARWNRPGMTAADMIDLFEKRHLVQTAAHLRDVMELI